MSTQKKALIRVTPTDPKTKKSLGAFTVYKNTVKNKREALRVLRGAFK